MKSTYLTVTIRNRADPDSACNTLFPDNGERLSGRNYRRRTPPGSCSRSYSNTLRKTHLTEVSSFESVD